MSWSCDLDNSSAISYYETYHEFNEFNNWIQPLHSVHLMGYYLNLVYYQPLWSTIKVFRRMGCKSAASWKWDAHERTVMNLVVVNNNLSAALRTWKKNIRNGKIIKRLKFESNWASGHTYSLFMSLMMRVVQRWNREIGKKWESILQRMVSKINNIIKHGNHYLVLHLESLSRGTPLLISCGRGHFANCLLCLAP